MLKYVRKNKIFGDIMEIKENINIEFKREFTTELKKEVVAFENTNEGIIYIGIDDFGNVIGIENADEVLNQVVLSIRNSVKPDITMYCKVKIEKIKNAVLINAPLMINFHKIKEGAKKFRGNNMYFLYGEDDPSFRYIEILDSIKNTACKYKIIKGEGHDFSTESLISELNYFFDGLNAENKGNRKNQVRLEGEENE